MFSESVPELTPVENRGLGDVLEDKVVGVEGMDAMDAYFGFSSSALFVIDALLQAALRERLAWEAGNVEMDPTVGVDTGVLPRVVADFERLEVLPDEGPGRYAFLRSTYKDMSEAQGRKGL